jgi:lauroyl/myristoyl acyltransferase
MTTAVDSGSRARVAGGRLDGDPGVPIAGAADEAAGQSSYSYDGLFWRRLAYLGSVYGPEWWKRLSPPVIATVIFALVRENRAGAIGNLQQVLGSRGRVHDTLAGLRLFVEFARCFTETLEFHGPRAREIEFEAPAVGELSELMPGAGGAVMLTSHFGSWEIAARMMERFARPVNVVMAREANLTVELFQRRAREDAGLRVLRSDTSMFASLNMIHALRRGEIVAMQLDRGGPGQVTRWVDFFGRKAAFQYGPFVLARLAGVPVLPVFAVRLGVRRYRVLHEPARLIDRRASEAETLSVMTDVVKSFEAHVRRHPYQWFQFRPFWQEPSDQDRGLG